MLGLEVRQAQDRRHSAPRSSHWKDETNAKCGKIKRGWDSVCAGGSRSEEEEEEEEMRLRRRRRSPRGGRSGAEARVAGQGSLHTRRRLLFTDGPLTQWAASAGVPISGHTQRVLLEARRQPPRGWHGSPQAGGGRGENRAAL